MERKIEKEIVQEFLDIIKNHRIADSPEINKSNEEQPTKRKWTAKAALVLSGLFILTITISIQTDSIKKIPGRYTLGTLFSSVEDPPKPKGDISIIPTAYPEIMDASIDGVSDHYFMGPGCSRRTVRPADPDFSNKNQKIPL